MDGTNFHVSIVPCVKRYILFLDFACIQRHVKRNVRSQRMVLYYFNAAVNVRFLTYVLHDVLFYGNTYVVTCFAGW